MIGLSGLITPSLDQMVDVATEMERRGVSVPLLIGGATTSRQHTAVKIAPGLRVRDGARARCEPRRRRRVGPARPGAAACARPREPGAAGAAARAARREAAPAAAAPRRGAREHREQVEFDDLREPPFDGTRLVRAHGGRARPVHRLAVLLPRLGPEGEVPRDPREPGRARAVRRRARGAATRSFGTARSGRAASTASGRRMPRATTSSSTARGSASCASRRSTATGGRTAASPTTSPRGTTRSGRSPSASTGPTSSPSAIAPRSTTTARSSSRRSPTGWPRPSPSGCTSARAASGTRPTSSSRRDDLIAGRFRGIRPAFGYPACPDHSEKDEALRAARARSVGLELTESFAMLPAAAVSGIYLAHPRARYFAVGRIGEDQLADYAARKGVPVVQVEQWLRPNLS